MEYASLKSNKFAKKALVFMLLFVVIFTQVSPTVFADTNVDNFAPSTCVTVDSLGDTKTETIGPSPEHTLAEIVSNAGIVIGDQTQDQIWHTTKATTTFEVTFLSGYTAAGDVFGYYKKGDINSFVPLFKNGASNSIYPSIPQAIPGQVYTIELPAGDYGFAMHMEFGGHAYRTSEISLNENSEDNVISYNVPNYPDTFVLGLEDLPFSVSDFDYNDIVVKVAVTSCQDPVNQAPVITLVGSNPVNLVQGSLYVEEGATAHDQEDGDITSNISTTGVVDGNTLGSYTVTYNVSDSQGLAATPVTRTVNVVPAPETSATVVATKIVCDAETDLPNWGNGVGPDIDSTTASTFLSTHPNCHLQADWQFQYAQSEPGFPDDNTLSPLSTPWVTFESSTNDHGVTTATIPVSGNRIWVREVLKNGYIPFTGLNDTDDVSAEMYCNNDHVYYDNLDWIDPVTAGDTYHCIAFNVKVENSCPAVNENGWYSEYYNYASTTVGMELSDAEWANTYGDPLSTVSSWTANWYDSEFFRFSRVDADMLLGFGFFPFDSAPEEITNGHDYHFGVHSSAIVTATTTADYEYTLTSDDDAWVYVDGVLRVDNSGIHGPINKTGSIHLTSGSHIVNIFFAERHTYDSQLSFEFIDKSLDIKANNPCNANTPPVLTLVGTSPMNITVGSTYTDLGATAQDLEDGDITANIVSSGTVNTAVIGTYVITYNVSDSKGLAATPVSRTVNVLEDTTGGGGEKPGKITFCTVFADNLNVVATTSSGLPASTFTINLATSTDFASTTIQTKTWEASAFAPNTKVISSTVNDADCVTYTNLDYGTYYYSQLSVSGSLWNTPKYSDKYSQPINNVFDFFNYSPELFTATTTDDSARNMNSDGQIVLTADNKDQSANVYVTYNPAPCTNCGGGGGSVVSNLAVTKSVDMTTANAGDTLTYIITVTNNGPYDATGVSLTETIPSLLDLISATSTYGSYSTTTNIWTIGNLPLGHSTTTLTIVGKVKTGSEGQKVTNTVSVTGSQVDSDTTNNTVSVDTNINPAPTPACTVNCGGGGGGGGNGPIVGSYGGSNGPIVPEVAGASTTSCYYLYDYLRKDFNNNPVEVKKLQVFLRDLEGFSTVQVTGIYDDQTITALDAFQWRYKDDILTPWGHTAPTSYTYILTKKKVNEIYCKMAFPVTTQQQEEIDNYRNFLNSLKNEGIYISNSTSGDVGVGNTEIDPIVVGGGVNSTTGLTTLAGISSTTKNIADDVNSGVLSIGKRFANMALAFMAWPFGSSFRDLFSKSSQCILGASIFGWVNLILLIIILVISYLWYKEYKNNKNIAKINQEIDLN